MGLNMTIFSGQFLKAITIHIRYTKGFLAIKMADKPVKSAQISLLLSSL